MFLIWWVTSVNRRLSTMVRIQDDRGQQVVTNGPYRYVRHPMYVGTVLFAPGIPLLLGSWWALIPAGMIIVIFIIRTAMEDKTLMEELPGYAEYTKQVRYRLIPGIW
jgi:protein-S-isoprenylcysteine O-methyltransferase Ste14